MQATPRTPSLSDLSDEQWAILEPFLPPPVMAGALPTTDLREVLNAIFSHDTLRHQVRQQVGKEPEPSAGSIDSQTIEATRTAGTPAHGGTTRRKIPHFPKDSQRRREDYSGKKKRHTKKNIVITDKPTGKIKGLGGTRAGRKHDNDLFDALGDPRPGDHRQDQLGLGIVSDVVPQKFGEGAVASTRRGNRRLPTMRLRTFGTEQECQSMHLRDRNASTLAHTGPSRRLEATVVDFNSEPTSTLIPNTS